MERPTVVTPLSSNADDDNKRSATRTRTAEILKKGPQHDQNQNPDRTGALKSFFIGYLPCWFKPLKRIKVINIIHSCFCEQLYPRLVCTCMYVRLVKSNLT